MSKYIYPENRLPSPQNIKLLALVGENKTVLEVGCALGYQTRSLKEIQKCRVTGIEIDADAANQARRYCDEMIVGDIEALDLDRHLSGKKFDAITFADVLEHLRSPVSTLIKVRPFLQNGGFIVASIPNITHSAVIYEMAHGCFDYKPLGLLDSTHIRFFYNQSIYQTFEEAGYKIVSIDRNRVAARETEFKTTPVTEEDIQFLEYVKRRNCEFDTYQFIVKAVPLLDSTALQSQLNSALEQIRLLELDASAQNRKIMQLESGVEWMQNRIGYRLFSTLKRLIKR